MPSDINHAVLDYAGDVTVHQAFDWVKTGQAVLVDIRTDAERVWVGFVPGAVPLAFKQWPGMQLNPDYDRDVTALAAGGKKLLMLCRSGIRSIAAAKRATELGFQAYNILEGFEGDADQHGHRGNTGGWQFHGLPWQQD
jgi:rhodanese-related sulfurtransferase